MQHAKTRLFSLFDICHLSTLSNFIIKFKHIFQNSLNYVKLQHLTAFQHLTAQYSDFAYKLTTIAFTDTHSFGLVWPSNMNNISNER